MDKNNIEVTRKINKLKSENNKLKKELYTLKNKNHEQIIKLKNYELNIEDFKNRILKLEQVNSTLEYDKENAINEKNIYAHKYKSLRGTCENAPNQINGLNKKVRELQDSNKQLEEKNKILKKHLKYVDKDENYNTINKLIIELQKKLTYKSLKYYGLKFDRLVDSVLVMRKNKDQIGFVNKSEIIIKEVEEIYGYVLKINNKVIFLDIDGNSFEIVSAPMNLDEFIDMPVLCWIINEEQVQVVKIYEEFENINYHAFEKTNRSKDDNVRKNMMPIIKYRSKIKVLILGSENRSQYTNLLHQMNLNVIWFDAYEHSPKRIVELSKSADIIIVCRSHIPHTVSNIIDADEEHVCYLDKDNIKLIYATVNYMIRMLQLEE